MSRFNTGNPIGSISEEDAYDNMACLDQAMNSTEPTWTDRFNVEKPTIDAALKSAGFMPAAFDFVTGGTLQPGDRNKAVYNPAPNGDNNWYRWNGVFPKEIAANSQPNPKNENNWVLAHFRIGIVEKEALRRTYTEAGYNFVNGSFEAGGTLVNANDVLLHERTGKAFSGPAGTVAAGTVPSGPNYINRGDETLRSALAAADSSVPVGGVPAGLNIIPVASIKGLATAPKIDGRQYSVAGFYAGSTIGGGNFVWKANKSKANHNCGTVLDPDRIDAWDGTHGDLATLFQVAIVAGSGCFVRINIHRITPDEFGAKGDDQTDDRLPILSALMESLGNAAVCFYLPPRRYFVGEKISVDCEGKSINVTGERGMSTIRSNVVGDTLLEFIDTQTSSFSDIVLRGNNLRGASGSGHGLVIYDSNPSGGTIFPQGCVIRGIRATGFQGLDTNRVSVAPLESCGVFVGGGKFTQVFDVNLSNCMQGLLFDNHGQIVVDGSTFVDCGRWGVAVLKNQSGVSIKDCDIVACGGVAGSVGSVYAGGGVYSENSTEVFGVDHVRVKTSKIGLCLSSGVVNIRNCSLEMESEVNGGDNVVIVRSISAVNIEGNQFYGVNSTSPLSVVYRGILCLVDDNARDSSLRVKGNYFRNNCLVEHFLSIEGLGVSFLHANIDENQFGYNTNAPYESVVNSCIKLRGITLQGSIESNNIISSGNAALKKIEKVVDVDSPNRFFNSSLSISRNVHNKYLGGVIEEPIKPTSLSGSDTYTTDSSGAILIPTPLARGLTRFVVTAQLVSTPVFVQINSRSSDDVVLRVYRQDGTSYGNSDIKLDWFATCQTDV